MDIKKTKGKDYVAIIGVGKIPVLLKHNHYSRICRSRERGLGSWLKINNQREEIRISPCDKISKPLDSASFEALAKLGVPRVKSVRP